jgi:hypothetical protein
MQITGHLAWNPKNAMIAMHHYTLLHADSNAQVGIAAVSIPQKFTFSCRS